MSKNPYISRLSRKLQERTNAVGKLPVSERAGRFLSASITAMIILAIFWKWPWLLYMATP